MCLVLSCVSACAAAFCCTKLVYRYFYFFFFFAVTSFSHCEAALALTARKKKLLQVLCCTSCFAVVRLCCSFEVTFALSASGVWHNATLICHIWPNVDTFGQIAVFAS